MNKKSKQALPTGCSVMGGAVDQLDERGSDSPGSTLRGDTHGHTCRQAELPPQSTR
jgi:hypothetical protein